MELTETRPARRPSSSPSHARSRFSTESHHAKPVEETKRTLRDFVADPLNG
jgi:hypothetical protein